MARTVLTSLRLQSYQLTDIGTLAAPVAGAQAIDQPNGMYVKSRKMRHLTLLCYFSNGPHTLILRAGVNPPAESAGQGDLTSTSLPATHFLLITGIEPARFAQPDQSAGGFAGLNVDFDAGTTGTIWAFEIESQS